MAEAAIPILEMKNVGKTYAQGGRAIEALRGANLRVRKGEFICLIRAIALKAAVAPQFAGDRALVATDQYGDLRLVMSGSLQSVYLVSLFPGKLFIVHLCASLTWRLIKHAYAIAACP